MLEKPDAGQIFINGQEITAKDADIGKIRRSMGMVYQDFGLFSNMNVMENLCIAPIKLLKMPKEDARKKALDLLSLVGLAHMSEKSVNVLSGGQKQRVAICRSLLSFTSPGEPFDPFDKFDREDKTALFDYLGLVIIDHKAQSYSHRYENGMNIISLKM